MECTLAIQTKSMINGLKKIKVRDNPKKWSDLREQGVVKTQPEIVEVVKASLCTYRCSLYFALIVEFLRMA